MVALSIETDGVKGIKLGLQALSHPKLPFLEDTIEQAAHIFSGEIRSRAKGGIKGKVKGGYVRHKGGQILATVTVTHPGARSMEFGRQRYYRKFKGNNRPGSKRKKGSMKAGQAFTSKGQRERVFVGIRRGDAAIAASQARVEELMANAILAEWERQGKAAK